MTTRPRLRLGSHLLPGLTAVALFAVMGYVFFQASFGTPAGFPGEASITAGIGYAMFDITSGVPLESESFLAVFEIIDVVLVAALVGAVMLARRESGTYVEALRSDGGEDEGGDD